MSHLSQGSLSKEHVPHAHEDREKALVTYDGVYAPVDPYPGGLSNTSLLIYIKIMLLGLSGLETYIC